MAKEERTKSTPRVPYIAIRDLVFFPHSSLAFEVGREASILALKDCIKRDKKLLLLAQKDPEQEEVTPKDLYKVGTLAKVRQVVDLGYNHYKVLCDGLIRVKATNFGHRSRVQVVKVTPLEVDVAEDDSLVVVSLRRDLIKAFEEYAMLSGAVAPDTVAMVKQEENVPALADIMVGNLDLSLEERQEQLQETNLVKRLKTLLLYLARESKLAAISQEISGEVQQEMDQHQKEFFLRQQMDFIQRELGEDDLSDIEQLRQKLAKKAMPTEHKEKLAREINRLDRLPLNSPETTVQRNWLDLVLDLPFGKQDEEKLDLARAREILDRDHYGLQEVKARILEYIAVRALQVGQGESRVKGPIICLVGPPGTGKTSIARSIAEALGRRYVRMALGGVRDEAEIRGHRRTYIGAMPGRIIEGLHQVGTDNPLFLLDEIDKLGKDFSGDPSSALLEVLDPDQNDSFQDHYVELPYDLSHVLFITTANTAWDIPEPLLDRMEVIQLSGYTLEEKLEIAKRHLLPTAKQRHALRDDQLQITYPALRRLISWYTWEAGVRQLDQVLSKLCRKTAMKLVEDKVERVKIGVHDLEDFLGRRQYDFEKAAREDRVGCATGLAWTSAGGDTLTIEVNVMPGKGAMELTGSLGEVMKESARAALTYIRSQADQLNLETNFFQERDIHIHVPAGAVPKDGPSAGITMVTALASAVTGKPVRHDLAMTGEITLRGQVMPIGGLKEKAVAARRAGIKEILIPKENERDIEDIPKSVRKSLKITPVDHADQVLRAALVELPK